MQYKRFKIDWVLIDQLAVGPAPRASRHLDYLEAQGIKSLLSLCSEDEAPPPDGLKQRFSVSRIVLPDHRVNRLPQLGELQAALESLESSLARGPVFVHCVAAVERSPLLCMAWLVTKHSQTPSQSLDYLMQVHPGSNPLPYQLKLLDLLIPNK